MRKLKTEGKRLAGRACSVDRDTRRERGFCFAIERPRCTFYRASFHDGGVLYGAAAAGRHDAVIVDDVGLYARR